MIAFNGSTADVSLIALMAFAAGAVTVWLVLATINAARALRRAEDAAPHPFARGARPVSPDAGTGHTRPDPKE